jgi:hypothetical protein
MDDSASVGGIERLRDRGGHPRGAGQRQGPLGIHEPVQVRAADETHGDVQTALGLAGAVDRDDALILQLGRQS